MTWTVEYAKDVLVTICLSFSVAVYASQALEYIPTLDAIATIALMGVTIAALNRSS